MSNGGYLFFQNNLFTEDVTVTNTQGLGDFVADNLLLPRLRPGFRWDPSADDPAELLFDLQVAQFKNKFAIDRTNNLEPGDEIKIYFSNISTDIGDSEEDYTIIVTDDNKPIVADLTTSEILFRYIRVDIHNNQITKPTFNEINWLAIGTSEDLSKDYEISHSVGDPSEVVANEDFIGDLRFQRRSEPFRTYSGSLRAVKETERTGLLLRLIEYASNGFPFIYCYDAHTSAREKEHLRVVKWLDAAESNYSLAMQYKPNAAADEINERWDLPFNLKEVGTIAIPYTLPAFVPEGVDPYSAIAGALLVLDGGTDGTPPTGCGILSEADFKALVNGVSGQPEYSFQFTTKPSAAQQGSTYTIAFQYPDIGAVPTGTKFRITMEWSGTGFFPRLTMGATQLDMHASYETTTEEVTYKAIFDFNRAAASRMDVWAVDNPAGNSSALTLGKTIVATSYTKTTNGYFILGGDYDDGKTAPIDPGDFINTLDVDTLLSDIYYGSSWLNNAVSMNESNSEHYWSLKVDPILSIGTVGGKLIVTPNCVTPDFR